MLYINDSDKTNEDIMKQFEETYGMEMSEKAIQSYDIISMLGEGLNSGIAQPGQLITYMKEHKGYEGISGTLRFDEKGCLIPNGDEILTFHNGVFEKE